MAPVVTLYNSLLDTAHLLLDRHHICHDSNHDNEILAAFRQHLPGKLFDKRKLPAFIIEAVEAATNQVLGGQTRGDESDEVAHADLVSCIEEARLQIAWAMNLPSEVFASLILELGEARWRYTKANPEAKHGQDQSTKAAKFLNALDEFQAAIEARCWTWEEYGA